MDEEKEEDLAHYMTLDFRIREKKEKKKKEEETKIKTNRKLEKTHLLPRTFPFRLVYSLLF